MKQYPSFGGMKKALFSVVILAVLLSAAGVASAMQTNVYTGSIGPRKPLEVYITTYRQGDVMVNVTWTGKPSGHGIAYYLWVEHCTDEAGTCYFSYDLVCHTNSLMWSTNEMTCTLQNGPAGRYLIQFAADTKATTTLEITAETDLP